MALLTARILQHRRQLMVSMAAQAALALRWPVPSFLVWTTIAAGGAATVLSFAILAEYFPKEMSRRANAALNLLHVGAAFALQCATGFIIARWPEARGAYPGEAHKAAMATTLIAAGSPGLVRYAAAVARTGNGAYRWPISSVSRCTASDTGDQLHNRRDSVDTASGSCAQASHELAFGRSRVGNALPRPGSSPFHDDQSAAVAVHIFEADRSGRNLAEHRVQALR